MILYPNLGDPHSKQEGDVKGTRQTGTGTGTLRLHGLPLFCQKRRQNQEDGTDLLKTDLFVVHLFLLF